MGRSTVLNAIVSMAEADGRVVGMVDYGASARGQADEWSDLDLVIFVADDEQPRFAAEWKTWAAEVGRLAGKQLLMAYDAGGHPRAVYDIAPVPLRIDLAFFKQSRIAEVRAWTSSRPKSAGLMVLFDRTGEIACEVERLISAPAETIDLQGTFEHVCGDLWTYLLRVDALIRRGEAIAARNEFGWYVLDGLAGLMRIESGNMGRWRLTFAVRRLGEATTPNRLAQLNACIPSADEAGLRSACVLAAKLGIELCDVIEKRRGWAWPRAMGEKVLTVMQAEAVTGRPTTA